MYDANVGRWLSPDPYGQFWSPYVGMGNDPINGVDPDGGFFGEDGIETDPPGGAKPQSQGPVPPDYNHLNNPTGRDLSTNNPFGSTSSGSPDNSVHLNTNLLSYAPRQDFSGFWGQTNYYWTNGNIGQYHYNSSGQATGYAPVTGAPDFIGGPLRKGQSAIKIGQYLFNPTYFHRVVKANVLNSAGNFAKVVGENPDIGVKGTQIILNGAKNGPFAGKTLETGLSILDFF
jgi:hypothetical protein